MALSYLFDTCVVKRLGHESVREVVEPLAAAGELARPSICDLEVGYSARNANEWDQLITALDAFDLVETTAAHMRRALQVQHLLAQRSQRGRKIPDLLSLPRQPKNGASQSFTTTPTSTSSPPEPRAAGRCFLGVQSPWSSGERVAGCRARVEHRPSLTPSYDESVLAQHRQVAVDAAGAPAGLPGERLGRGGALQRAEHCGAPPSYQLLESVRWRSVCPQVADACRSVGQSRVPRSFGSRPDRPGHCRGDQQQTAAAELDIA